ncbi:sphingosine 1-phosphate receptor 5b [Pholidichthys leucotaenia]
MNSSLLLPQKPHLQNDFVAINYKQGSRKTTSSMEALSLIHAGTPLYTSTIPTSPTPSPCSFLQFFCDYQQKSVILKHYNYTSKLKDRDRDGLKPESIVVLVVCLLIILENAVVLLAIWRNKKFHLPMYYLLGNLTLSDLLAGIAYMTNIIMSGPNTLKLTPLLWFIREGGVFITLAASVISLLAIAIERHVTMVTMRPYHGAKRGRMLALIGGSWALAGFLGVLPILGWNCICRLDQCSMVLPLYAKSYILFCVSVFSAVLLAIVVLYVRVFRIVRTNTQRQRVGLSASMRKSFTRKSEKYVALLKTVTIVLGVFIACWLPLFLLLLLDVFCPTHSCPVLHKAPYFLLIAIVNSLLNPIIYTLTSKDMRRAILRLLCRPCLMTRDGQVKKIGMPFLECSFSKTEVASQKLEGGLETTLSSGNNITTPSSIKAFYPKFFKP